MQKRSKAQVPERLKDFVSTLPGKDEIRRETQRCRAELAFLKRLEKLAELASISCVEAAPCS